MNINFQLYLKNIVKQLPATTDAIESLVRKVDFVFPNDYLKLLKDFNGGEGGVGENGWLFLYSAEEVVFVNEDFYYLMEQIPDYFLFRKDAADTGYAFHKKNHSFHSFGLMSNFKTDPIEYCGGNLEEFLSHLFNE